MFCDRVLKPNQYLPMQTPSIIIICGQTATGKSDLAVQYALAHNGEIVSADSRQIYRGLNVGSNKITPPEMEGVPHQGIDIADPETRFTAADFQSYARNIITDILSRGKTPILVGGTGFYIDATLFADFDFEERKGSINYNSASYFFDIPHQWIGLCASREYLVDRICARAERAMTAVTTEIQQLQSQGTGRDWLHGLGLEYRYGTELLEGTISELEYTETITTKTWQYARRQMTWFKRNPHINWFDIAESKPILSATDTLTQALPPDSPQQP